MTGILQGNAALAAGVLALVFILVSTIPMRRPTITVLASAALLAMFVLFHLNHKLSTGEPMSATEQAWYMNSGIITCVALIAACGLAHWMHKIHPCDSARQQLERSNATVRAHR